MTRSRSNSMVVIGGSARVNHKEEHTQLSIHKSGVNKSINKIVAKGLRISTQACKLKKPSGESKSKVENNYY